MKGFFLVFEGIDKCGKSTQLNLLARRLRQAGKPLIITREPGGTPLGEKIREFLLDAKGRVCPKAELLLYEASRAQHVQHRILPALRAGKIVLCDRFSLSTLAYQGMGRGLDASWVRALDRFATAGMEPDLTLILDLPVSESMRRIASRPDRMERKRLLEKVRKAYLHLSRKNRKIIVVDAKGTPDQIHGRIIERLHHVLSF